MVRLYGWPWAWWEKSSQVKSDLGGVVGEVRSSQVKSDLGGVVGEVRSSQVKSGLGGVVGEGAVSPGLQQALGLLMRTREAKVGDLDLSALVEE